MMAMPGLSFIFQAGIPLKHLNFVKPSWHNKTTPQLKFKKSIFSLTVNIRRAFWIIPPQFDVKFGENCSDSLWKTTSVNH